MHLFSAVVEQELQGRKMEEEGCRVDTHDSILFPKIDQYAPEVCA